MPWTFPTACAADSVILQVDVTRKSYRSTFPVEDTYVLLPSNVIDLGIDITVILDSTQSQGQVITNIINIVSNFFSPVNRELGQNVYIAELKRLIQAENGVISTSNILVYNKVGGEYSSSQTSQEYENVETRQIKLVNETIFAEPNQIYQIRFPNKDITVSVLNYKTVNIS